MVGLIHAAVIMDLVGHDVSLNGLDSEAQSSLMSTLAPLLFMTGTESHPGLRGVLERAGDIDKLKVVPTLNRYVDDMSDHGVFRQNGVPYLFLSCGRWEHYHKETDTPDRLNYLEDGADHPASPRLRGRPRQHSAATERQRAVQRDAGPRDFGNTSRLWFVAEAHAGTLRHRSSHHSVRHGPPRRNSSGARCVKLSGRDV